MLPLEGSEKLLDEGLGHRSRALEALVEWNPATINFISPPILPQTPESSAPLHRPDTSGNTAEPCAVTPHGARLVLGLQQSPGL